MLVRTPLVLVTNRWVPAKTVKELVQLAKSKPGTVTFASVGPGSPTRLLMEMLRLEARVDVTNVPYKDAGLALIDLVGGQVDAMFPTLPSVAAHVASGRLRALAVTADTPSAALPGVPLMKDDYPGFVAQYWVGLVAPAKTPPAIIARLNSDIVKVLRSEELKTRFGDLGLETVGSTPDDFGQSLKEELERWERVIRAQKITIE
jgi:tripartite-type tricarboxylate transporter receptor subunit TctC